MQYTNLTFDRQGNSVTYIVDGRRVGTLTMFNDDTIQRLTEENRQLRKENKDLQNELVQLRTRLRRLGRA